MSKQIAVLFFILIISVPNMVFSALSSYGAGGGAAATSKYYYLEANALLCGPCCKGDVHQKRFILRATPKAVDGKSLLLILDDYVDVDTLDLSGCSWVTSCLLEEVATKCKNARLLCLYGCPGLEGLDFFMLKEQLPQLMYIILPDGKIIRWLFPNITVSYKNYAEMVA